MSGNDICFGHNECNDGLGREATAAARHLRQQVEYQPETFPEDETTKEVESSSKSVLQEADEIAGQDRSRDYGHPFVNHRRIAAIWSVQLELILKRPLLPREVALMMVGLKLAREINTKKRDNLVDAAGYIKCIDMIDDHVAKAGNGV